MREFIRYFFFRFFSKGPLKKYKDIYNVVLHSLHFTRSFVPRVYKSIICEIEVLRCFIVPSVTPVFRYEKYSDNNVDRFTQFSKRNIIRAILL